MEYDKKELEILILEQNKPYSFIGGIYGVSGAAIKKAAKKLGIPLPKRRGINESENFSHKGYKKTSNVFSPDDEIFINIINDSSTWAEIGKKLGYKCKSLSPNVKDAIKKRCSMLGIELNITFNSETYILNKTKGELFTKRKNWQSARSAIRNNARKNFLAYNNFPKCAICGYDKYVEVAHIKAVSDFPDEATISEINSISNLIGLCPNHHWEYDNGIIKI